MLILTLNIGKERYGIDAKQVLEVVPLVELQNVPLTDERIRGLFNYRGTPTPVVDLCQVFEQRSCNNNLSTRTILINPRTLTGDQRAIGLIAESVTEVLHCEPGNLSETGISNDQNACLKETYKHGDELIQIIDPEYVLPESIAKQLLKDSETGRVPA